MIFEIFNRLRKYWDHLIPTFVFIVLLSVFIAYSVFLACNLQRHIIPDENAHIAFSEHFAVTWGIPNDTPETYKYGWYIKQNPFLYYWVNGRALNALNLVIPDASTWKKLVFLRLLNVIFSTGSVVFCYLISKELIKHKWWQILPVFLLTNTLMFVFLSAGVSYDNLANFFSFVSLYFFIRVINGKDYLSNSLGLILFICLATLVKYPILPLALGMGIAWIIYTVHKRAFILPLKINSPKLIALGLFTTLAISVNLAIYGVNLLTYHSITPACTDLLNKDQCELSPYVVRHSEIALDYKMTILESIQRGYPDPLEYVIYSWTPNMLYRVYGVLAHLSYFPAHIITFYYLLLLWYILLLFRYWKQSSFAVYSLLGIFLFYSLVLFYMNYSSELVYGFKQIAVQGRYIFPVIGAAYVLIGSLFTIIQNRTLRLTTLLITLVLFLYGGPIKFLILRNTVFNDWFIK
jgi:hypothetical protein